MENIKNKYSSMDNIRKSLNFISFICLIIIALSALSIITISKTYCILSALILLVSASIQISILISD